ncbi:MAG: sulfite exporter TauE/SafE family protein [Rhodomicrobium sp.]|nr:sulfite exporter TauE/SafE family protein [Rhodomicrobium sp.]
MDDYLLIACVGFLAQLVDGALGMAYGTVSAAVLLAMGVSPANTSAAVHTAQIFTCAASGMSHIWNRNVLWPIFWRLAIPGVIGAALGAAVLVNVDQAMIKPWISLYLGVLGLLILYRVARPNRIRKPLVKDKAAIPVGFVAAMADSVGGGGWGPIATSTLVGRGHEPRFTVGSVNAAEFVVKTASAAAFFIALGVTHLEVVIPLVAGGLLAAPFGGYLVRIIPARSMMLLIGVLISGLSGWQIVRMIH